jgi:hypothetical protein
LLRVQGTITPYDAYEKTGIDLDQTKGVVPLKNIQITEVSPAAGAGLGSGEIMAGPADPKKQAAEMSLLNEATLVFFEEEKPAILDGDFALLKKARDYNVPINVHVKPESINSVVGIIKADRASIQYAKLGTALKTPFEKSALINNVLFVNRMKEIKLPDRHYLLLANGDSIIIDTADCIKRLRENRQHVTRAEVDHLFEQASLTAIPLKYSFLPDQLEGESLKLEGKNIDFPKLDHDVSQRCEPFQIHYPHLSGLPQ